MGEEAAIIDGHLKIREGKKWKSRFAVVTRLSPVADCVTLQLWRDGKEIEKKLSPTKGSINLSDYLGFESSFNLDKESHTIALIFREMVIILALPSREILIKWQVRLTGQFESGQQFSAHVVSAPKKSKLSEGPIKLHLQNNKFSITVGIPPILIHTWSMIDLRRFGSVDGGRFCFEGGTRCGKGEGLHVLRVDNPDDIQISFDLASKGKLEWRKQSSQNGVHTGISLSSSPSVASNLSKIHRSGDSASSNGSSFLNTSSGSMRSRDDLIRNRSRSRSMNKSGAWSSLDGGLTLSSPDTLSLNLSDMDHHNHQLETQSHIHHLEDRVDSPDITNTSPNHLVSRRALLDRIGHASSKSCGSESEFYPGAEGQHVHADLPPVAHRRQGSLPWRSNFSTLDRMSCSSGDSHASSTYDQPKTVLKVTRSPTALRRGSTRSGRDTLSPPPPQKTYRKTMDRQLSEGAAGDSLSMRRMIAAAPCKCDKARAQQLTAITQPATAYDTYDVPRNIGRQAQDSSLQYYDTPRNIAESLAASAAVLPANSSHSDTSSAPGDGMGNYDFPTSVPLPVFTKPCGCVMQLKRLEEDSDHSSLDSASVMSWTCVKEETNASQSGEEAQLNIPRVRLTGQGKMPVVDMSKINSLRCFSEPPSSASQQQQQGYTNTNNAPIYCNTSSLTVPGMEAASVRSSSSTALNGCQSRPLSPAGLPPLPPLPSTSPTPPSSAANGHHQQPLYAQVNKAAKKRGSLTSPTAGRPQPPIRNDLAATAEHLNPYENYTNMEFANSLSLYENSRDVVQRLRSLEAARQPQPQQQQVLVVEAAVHQNGGDNQGYYQNIEPYLIKQQQQQEDHERRHAHVDAQAAQDQLRGLNHSHAEPAESRMIHSGYPHQYQQIQADPRSPAQEFQGQEAADDLNHDHEEQYHHDESSDHNQSLNRDSVGSSSDVSISSNYGFVYSMDVMSDRFNTIKLMPKHAAMNNSHQQQRDTTPTNNNDNNNGLSEAITGDRHPNNRPLGSAGYMTLPRSRDLANNTASYMTSSFPSGVVEFVGAANGYYAVGGGQGLGGHQACRHTALQCVCGTVTMRRSASVPCKRDRDSVSSGGSSDSGVSTGSPRQSTILNEGHSHSLRSEDTQNSGGDSGQDRNEA